jgi:hypothetical protein
MQSCICNTIETVERSWANGRFTAVVRFRPDDDRLPPDYWGSEPAFVQIPTARELEDQITEAFGADRYGYPSARAKKARDRLAAGEVVEDDQGNWYYGVVEYRHSDSLFVLCQSDGHHSIRRSLGLMGVDQILDGWIKITRQNRIDWRIHGRKGVNEAARAKAKGALETWEAYLNGWYTGYTVELLDDGRLVEDASCWGFPGIEDAKEAAEDIVMYWQRQYPPAAETACDTP